MIEENETNDEHQSDNKQSKTHHWQKLHNFTKHIAHNVAASFTSFITDSHSTGTEHTSAKARHTSVAIRSGSPPKFNHLFIGPLPTFSESFMQIRLEAFAQTC